MNEGVQQPVEDFVNLLTEHEVRLRAYALSLVGNWPDGDEVMQQASIVMWRKFNQFRPGTNFLAWGFRIVNLTARDWLKRRRRNRVRFSAELSEAIAVQMQELSDVMAARERALALCVAKLTLDQRNLLELRYNEKQSIDGIAARLGRTSQAIYQALSRVRRSLFDCVTRRVALGDLT